jgi:hypothetical protein
MGVPADDLLLVLDSDVAFNGWVTSQMVIAAYHTARGDNEVVFQAESHGALLQTRRPACRASSTWVVALGLSSERMISCIGRASGHGAAHGI